MFGYITPLINELRVREYQEYKSVYCGLCKELGRRYGFISRMLLNYDLVLIALVADGLSGEVSICQPERCIANPLVQKPVRGSSFGLSLAADALVLLGWYKLKDDLADSGFLHRVGWKKSGKSLVLLFLQICRSEILRRTRRTMVSANGLKST